VLERFAPDRVEVNWDAQEQTLPDASEAMIDTAWRERLEVAGRTGQRLYNGPMARLSAWRIEGERLILDTGPTDYRRFVGTNLCNGHRADELGIASFANPLGTSAVVITADGRLVLGRRRREMAFHGGYLHPVGGTLEPADRDPVGRMDVFASMRRELLEELCVEPGEIVEMVCTGIIRDCSIHQPEMVFDARVTLRLEEVLARFEPDAPDQEHTVLECCHDEPEAVAPFAKAAAPITPVAVGALLLHGHHDWGRDWYEQTCDALFGKLPRVEAHRG